MAKLFYQLGGPGQLNIYDDPQQILQTDLENTRDVLAELLSLSDLTREALAQGGVPALGIPGSFESLSQFDDYLSDERDRILDVLDYFGYETRVENLTVRDAAWYTPEAIESVSHENVGEEASNAIDGDFGTWWQSDDASGNPRTIVFRVRSYPKKFMGFRLRISNAGEGRVQLQDVTIKSSGALAMIDDPGNVVEAGVDFAHDGDAWMEYNFAMGAGGRRYLKLEIPASLHADPDQIRIREIEVRVGITNHDK